MDAQSKNSIEKSLLRGKWGLEDSKFSSPALELAKSVVECRFSDVLRSDAAKTVFKQQTQDIEASLETIYNPSYDNSLEGEVIRLSLAIASLHAFVQANWTGPDLDVQPLDILNLSSDTLKEDLIQSKAVAELAYGGEPAYHLAKALAFLRISQILLDLPYQHLKSVDWWKLRATLVHEQILDEPVAPTFDFAAALIPLTTTFAAEPDLAGQLYLEIGRLAHHTAQDKLAAEYFVKAARATGLQYELSGALGKRTKFQVTELSQLVLLAESRLLVEPSPEERSAPEDSTPPKVEASSTVIKESNIPETLSLNDDTLLERTEFTSSQPLAKDGNSLLQHIDPSSQPALHPIDQCILLSLCLNVRNTSPSHGLTQEQMSPYVSRVISHPRNWSVHTTALLLRSRLEASRTRTVERSTLQLQALIDQMPTSDSSLSERLRFYHSIPLPSKWDMERELAERFLSLGVVRSALEIFERLEMWEDVVKCYGSLEKREQGIAIVRDLLEGKKAESDAVISRGKASSTRRKEVEDSARESKLWCLLGDLEPERAVEHYEKAWVVSRESSGRAMRSLGGYYFSREKYAETMVCLGRAVKINPLLTRSWFVLGCAAMRLEDWTEARNAFSRCVSVDAEDGESWNNLASVYLRMGTSRKENGGSSGSQEDGNGDHQTVIQPANIPFENKLLAFRALKEGLRYRYENWRMWLNYMVVAMDVGELQEACRALSRIVEQTSDKVGAASVDEDVVDRLVDAVTRAPTGPAADAAGEGIEEQNPNEGLGLFRPVSNLLERTILPRVSTPRIFRAYGRLLSWQGKWEEAIKAYLDWYRSATADTVGKGELSVEGWRAAVAEVEDIVDILINFGPKAEGYKWRLQAKSILRTFMGRTKDFEDEPEWEKLKGLLDELKTAD